MSARVIAVLERNRAAAQRVARVLSAAGGVAEVIVAHDALELQERLPRAPDLLACDVSDLDVARRWRVLWPEVQVLLWTGSGLAPVLPEIRDDRAFRNILGWPSFASMPRPWELALVARKLLDPSVSVPKVADLLAWGAHVQKWRPRTSADRDAIVHEVAESLERGGVPPRIANRVGEIAHELLMNAMYDAPVDAWGSARYAQDRKQDVVLEDHEVPTVRFGYDGFLVALEVVDPFGRLADHHVIDGILRGSTNASGGDAPVLDTSHGGAGLGMSQIYSSSASLIVDVRPLESTRVLWVLDVDMNPRDARGMPASLHLFREPDSADSGGWR